MDDDQSTRSSKTCSAGIGATVTIVDAGVEIHTLLGTRTYKWSQLRKLVVTSNGRRVTRQETPYTTSRGLGIFREPNFIAVLSLKGRLRRITLTSEDREAFFAVVGEIWSHASALGVPIKTGAIEVSRFDLETWLGVDCVYRPS